MTMPREDGFYWVRWKDSGLPEIGHCSAWNWVFCGGQYEVDERRFTVLSDRLAPPEGV